MRTVPRPTSRTAAAVVLGLIAAALAVPAPAAAGATPGRYIVTLSVAATAGRSAVAADAVAGKVLTAGHIVKTYRSVPALAVRMTATEARRVAADPAVAAVEPDQRVRIETVQRGATWNLDRIDQRSRALSRSYTPTDDGSAVHAYVIDTGIRIGHDEFQGRASYGYDFAGHDSAAADCNGHGTHVAATLGGRRYGVAKQVRLVAVRVLDCAGEGYLSDVLDGVDWVTRHAIKPAVANMSLGGFVSPALDAAVRTSISSGVTYVVAAGNSADDARYYSPAGVRAAITVGATDVRDRRANWSNWGPAVDLFAPGVGIWSAWRSGDSSRAVLSGTSMAAPHVAGAAALVLDAYPAYTPAEVSAYLVRGATVGRVVNRGAGSPNRLLFVPPPPRRPVIRTVSLPAASVGEPYRARLRLAATRRGTWSVASGTLPEGLRLSGAGYLSGTPIEAGTGRVLIRFTDFVPHRVNRAYTLAVGE
ncbi:S8 family peptidase [Mangrovihabitans endophyticus]|uniref:Serine protease, subtilisin family n=1 Tax=Mangrovihabitans endophyticus TaxID=1751298 RepID=A0A8J3FMQ1_9ACTN|nr:S8 family peptidase [Mangrovihabitans endophyticus]GGK81146.1 hypothetical protein GCM10012284_13850 [Mangrovihabitans endophyticus]